MLILAALWILVALAAWGLVRGAAITRRQSVGEQEPPAVAKAVLTPDDPSLPADDLLDVWHAVSRDPDPVVRGFADEVAGWLRDFTPPVIRPATPEENDR